MNAVKVCRFFGGDSVTRVGLVSDDGHVVDVTPAGISTLSQVLESADPVALLNGIDRNGAAGAPRFGRRSSPADRAPGSVGGWSDLLAKQGRAHGRVGLQRNGL
jgi:hypothetical protein